MIVGRIRIGKVDDSQPLAEGGPFTEIVVHFENGPCPKSSGGFSRPPADPNPVKSVDIVFPSREEQSASIGVICGYRLPVSTS